MHLKTLLFFLLLYCKSFLVLPKHVNLHENYHVMQFAIKIFWLMLTQIYQIYSSLPAMFAQLFIVLNVLSVITYLVSYARVAYPPLVCEYAVWRHYLFTVFLMFLFNYMFPLFHFSLSCGAKQQNPYRCSGWLAFFQNTSHCCNSGFRVSVSLISLQLFILYFELFLFSMLLIFSYIKATWSSYLN